MFSTYFVLNHTFVMVMPASCIVILEHLGRIPGVQNIIHLVLLTPCQGLAKDLSCFVDVEVPGTQES